MATPAVAAVACPVGVESDFNGDGQRDVVIADPEATVAGHAGAGAVHVVYGGGKGNVQLSQDSAGAPGAPEGGDRFGHSLAVYDANLDGCSDLVVGIPYEDLSVTPESGEAVNHRDAGLVQIYYGASAGLGTGPAVKEILEGEGQPLAGSIEHEDWIGYSLAAGKSSSGVPFLAVGAPGEDIGTTVDAGAVYYMSGTALTKVTVHQDTNDAGEVPGVAEQDDRFGYSLAATPTHLVVGTPGEALGTATFAGGVAVFSHTLVSNSPKPLAGLAQDQETISGEVETADRFGTALAMVPYRPSGATSTTESLLAVGVPGEDLLATVDAGAVHFFRLNASTTVTQTAWVDQNIDGMEGDAEAGDFFGQQLAAVNSTPSATSTATTTRVAIGAPGEEWQQEDLDKGGVQITPMVGPPGADDHWIAPGYGVGDVVDPHMYTGLSLGSTPSLLYVGAPYGEPGARAVHGFSWNVTSGGASTVSYKPGTGGIPAGGKAFGAVVQ
ncbi:VCBS repeat-containing protein [Streptomyces sp. NPDC079167]|uniref:FG-GAP repeat domain-containing protein n=1 Tax=Streptomyces sp. NPDC079167 TaxID=3154513 RepID=UPI0034217C98